MVGRYINIKIDIRKAVKYGDDDNNDDNDNDNNDNNNSNNDRYSESNRISQYHALQIVN